MVEIYVTDPWISLLMSRTHGVNSFITYVPDLSKSPPTFISCPPGVEEITKRIQSVEGTVNSTNKIDALLALHDNVYRDRQDAFQRGLSSIVKLIS